MPRSKQTIFNVLPDTSSVSVRVSEIFNTSNFDSNKVTVHEAQWFSNIKVIKNKYSQHIPKGLECNTQTSEESQQWKKIFNLVSANIIARSFCQAVQQKIRICVTKEWRQFGAAGGVL